MEISIRTAFQLNTFLRYNHCIVSEDLKMAFDQHGVHDYAESGPLLTSIKCTQIETR
jgi:hypothetical protein